MALLKKIKGASLLETLSASVIIMVLFMIASLSLNNVFLNSVKSDDYLLHNRLEEIKYLSTHDILGFPFYEEGSYWLISGKEIGMTKKIYVQNVRNGKDHEIQINN